MHRKEAIYKTVLSSHKCTYKLINFLTLLNLPNCLQQILISTNHRPILSLQSVDLVDVFATNPNPLQQFLTKLN